MSDWPLEVVTIGGLQWSIRTGTSDWNTVNAAVGHDEYLLAGEDVAGKLVFDIGAHIGSVGVWLASRGAHVVFVEPLPENVERIKANLALNGCGGDVIEGAVATNRIALGPEGDHHEFIGNINVGHDLPRSIDVTEYTFEHLAAFFGVPDIVKLDCEGGEWAVFPEPSLRKVRLIVGEYHPDALGGEYTSADIIRYLPEHAVEVDPENDHFGPFRARLR